MFAKETYIQRRAKLKETVGSGLILLLGNEESSMNYKDNCYSFRQDSSFLYYFGLDKPGMIGIIDVDKDEEIIFGNDLTIDDIVWTGPLPTVAELAQSVGVTKSQPVSHVTSIVKTAKATGQQVHFLPVYRPENAIKIHEWTDIELSAIKESASIKLTKAVIAQRVIKTAEEVAELENQAKQLLTDFSQHSW
ncbi:MAG: hypothetical protein CMO01_24530 [Thalassobius sp.]|nr:hypothetical protein [Thalassovita sp.]